VTFKDVPANNDVLYSYSKLTIRFECDLTVAIRNRISFVYILCSHTTIHKIWYKKKKYIHT